jgi:hypothetical protein
VRGFIETMLETELDAVLARPRYGRQAARSDETTGVSGHRHGRRGITEITVPRARLDAGEDKTVEWKSKALRAYQRRTMAADALIASSYLAGTNTRRVRRALAFPSLDPPLPLAGIQVTIFETAPRISICFFHGSRAADGRSMPRRVDCGLC